MIIDEIKNINETKSALRKFGLTVGIVLLVITKRQLFLFWNNWAFPDNSRAYLSDNSKTIE